MFTPEPPADYAELVSEGAKIIDVRTPAEFNSGKVKGSKNIPLQQLSAKMENLSKNGTYIVCCASGARSASAKRMMKANGFEDVYNGGSWQSVQSQL